MEIILIDHWNIFGVKMCRVWYFLMCIMYGILMVLENSFIDFTACWIREPVFGKQLL